MAAAPDADILVNNVGTAILRDYRGIDSIAAIPDEEWLTFFQLNVMSGVRLSRHYLTRMVAEGWGRVVFVSSESAVNFPKEILDYGMTKTAQLVVSRGLAEAVAGSRRCRPARGAPRRIPPSPARRPIGSSKSL